MRLLILIASFWVLVASKPELYKEKEDFQYSRSSSDEGSKSGFYGAQRGNMGGNYERAHNMDSLAQHHMSTVVRNVEGELGEGANTRTGTVFSAANSRGLYGSGNYDVSNLRGRNFGESAISGDSLSQSALSQKSGYGSLYSAADKYSSSQAQNSGLSSGYQSSGLASQYLQTDAQKAADNIYRASNYNYDSEGANSYKYAQSSSQAQSDYENSNRASGYDHKARSNLVYTTPVRVYIKPGARIAIPVAAQVYDASAVQGLSTVHSDSEILDTTGQQLHYKPTSNAKHYESAYRYRKEWEKHNSIPVTVAPMENPIPTNSELYEAANNNNQYESGLTSAANRQSSSANSAYLSGYSASTKNALSSQSRHQSQKYDSGISASNAYNHGTSSSNAYKSGASDSNAYTLNGYDASLAANLATSNNLIEDIGSKPKSYQSSYSYHKSWERRGDPYVIKPVGGDLSEQTSQRLTAKQGYACTYCLDESQQRVRRDIDFGQHSQNQWDTLGDKLEDIGQQTQSHWGKLEDLGQHAENQLPHNLENLSQQTQDKLEDFGQQTQSHWGKLEDLGQEAENQLTHNLENLSQQTQDKLEDFGQQTQSHWGKLEDLGQEAENQLTHNLENLSQQTQDKLEDFGQQTQSHWGKLEGLGQQAENQLSHNLEDLSQQTQDKLEDFGQQTQSQWGKLEDLGQHAQNQLSHNLGGASQQIQDKLEDIGQQTQSQWSKLEDLGQRGKNKLSHDLEDLSQQTQDKLEDIGQQTQSHWDKLGDLGQQTLNQFGKQNQWELGHSNQQTQSHWTEQEQLDHKNNWDNLGSLGHFSPGMQSHFGDIQNLEQSHFGHQNQNHWDKLGDLSQQTQSHWDNFGDLGQQTQNQWDNMGNLNRQTHSHFGNLGSLGQSHFGQQTQNQWDRLGDLNQQTQSHWGKLEDLGQQTQSDWNLGQQTQSVANFDQVINGYGGHHLNKPWTVDSSYVPYYTNYWEIPESYYAQESLQNINKMWNFHKKFEQGSYSHHHDFELKKNQDEHNTHNFDVSFNVNHFNHPEKPKENAAAQNSEGKLILAVDKNVQNGTTTAKYFSLDDKTVKTTQKTVIDDEIHESFTLADIRPIDIGRGDIGPEDTLIETTDINEKKSYMTPEEIESLSLTKYQGDISEEPLKMSVTGLNQGSIPGNKRKLRNELSTVIESVTISTAKSKENLENYNINFTPTVYGSTPKSNFLSTSSIKAFNEKQNEAKPLRANGEQDERKLSDTFEEQNWGLETQNFDEQKIKHLELFEQNVAQDFEHFEKQNKGQHLEPFEDQILVQQLEPLEKKKLGCNLETLEDPYCGQQLENFQQQNWEQQIQNFEQQNKVQNLEPFEQQLKPLENMEQLETNQKFVGQLNIPEEQNILTNHFGQEAQTLAHRNILQNTETSSKGIETSPENKYLQEQNEQKGQKEANSKNQDDIMSTPIEPTTKSPGFWGKFWNKTKNAKDSLVSWFHS